MFLVKSKRDPSDIQYYHICLQIHRQIAQAIKQEASARIVNNVINQYSIQIN